MKPGVDFHANLTRLDEMVMGNLARHPVYRGGALPLHAATPLYVRYQAGMEYGEHLDDPIMGRGGVVYRSDVAVTVFLSAPDEYDGGELMIRGASPYGLNLAREKLLQSAPDAEETAQVNAAYLNLIRMWSEL